VWYRADNVYVKRVSVRRGSKAYTYLRLVESYRVAGRVRQRVIAHLGREEELKASGQLEALAGAFARLDPPLAGARREVGPLLLVHAILERLDVAGIVARALPARSRARLSAAEVVVALIANRLAAPAPLYDVAGWAAGSALQELFGIPAPLLNDDRLGRALDALAPVAEAIRGAVALAAIERFGLDAARLHLDLTTLRVAGAYEGSTLVAKGWGPDRRVARQVRLLQATNGAGVPLYVRPHPGDAAELVCIGAALESLRALLGPGLVVCADSALGHLANLCAAERAGLRFVVPLREASGFRERFEREVGQRALRPLDYVSRRERHRPPEQRTRYRGALRAFDTVDPASGAVHRFRVAYIWSSEEARSVADARERALTKAETALARLARGLARRSRDRPGLDAAVAAIVRPVAGLLAVDVGWTGERATIGWRRDRDGLAAAARTDGLYALATNLPGRLGAGDVLRLYKDQPLVELRHRDAKGPLRVRPIFLHTDARIEALLSVVGLALVVFGLIELEVRRALGADERLPGLLPEGRPARPTGRNILAAFQGLGLSYTAEGVVCDRLTRTQRQLLELLDAPSPWPEARTGVPA
jgi:transposase